MDGRNFKDDILNVVVLPASSNDSVVISGKKVVKGSLEVGGMGVNVISGVVNGKKLANIARLDEVQEFNGNICCCGILVEHLKDFNVLFLQARNLFSKLFLETFS